MSRDPTVIARLVEEATGRLSVRASGVLVRRPTIDAELPDTCDLDFLAFTDLADLHPERLAWSEGAKAGSPPIDVTWLPVAWLDDPREMASRGLIAHRLMTSDLVYSRTDQIVARCRATASVFREPSILERRLEGFFQMAGLTVREVGITWDFPALAHFWLHMAHAACLAAALDGLGRLCPNVFTRPIEYLPALGDVLPERLRARMIRSLCLDADPWQAMGALQRVHDRVSRQFPEPWWPANMRDSTRFEYRYWMRHEELRWRILVAEELCRRGRPAAAVSFVRFHAYAIARAPMVHACAAEGRDVSYLRPEGAVLPALQRLCPDVIDDLSVVLGGSSSLTGGAVERALAAVYECRDCVLECLQRTGAPALTLAPWAPHERRERHDEREASCRT